MLDLKEEQCSVSEDQSNPSSTAASPGGCGSGSGSSSTTTSSNGDVVKRCTDCQTTTTPLWRGGPAGPKTMCNACGIKYHKKRRALLGIDKGKADKSKKKSKSGSNMSSNGNNLGGMPLKIKVMASGISRQRENLEVEQAAMLLMALSYGSVYA